MNREFPTISVIIPTHNRESGLRRTLDALRAQNYPLDRVEVLVVADGCTDRTLETLQDYNAGFPLHILEQPNQGPAVARNYGAAQANGQLLIFLDDDIEASPHLFKAHALAHQAGAHQVIIGYSPPVFEVQSDFLRIGLRSWWEDLFFEMRRPGHRYAYRDLLTGNFSLSADLFAAVRGFDPDFGCHEDYELGVRLIDAGASFSFVPDAVGYHHDRTDLKRLLQRKYDEGRTDVLIGRRHPKLRSVLSLARFTSVRSRRVRLLCMLAFGLPVAGSLLVFCCRGGLVALEWVRNRRRWRGLLRVLLDYCYWRGVAKELRTPRALADFLADGSAPPDTITDADIDLAEGLEAAERRLDEERPAGVNLRYAHQPVGRILPQFGAERLRGVHLRPFLATKLARQLVRAVTMKRATEDTTRSVKCQQTPQFVFRKPAAPLKILDLELSQKITPIEGLEQYYGLFGLVRYHGRPVGKCLMAGLRQPVVYGEQIREAICTQLGPELESIVLGKEFGVSVNGTVAPIPISAIVCTRNRVTNLESCLNALLALDHPDYEIIVVDNAPTNDDAAQLVARFPVRYIREERPGLDWARNRGIAEARHDIVAFVDDDARPDHFWLRAIASAFAEPEVMAIAGLVAPAELETPAQNMFEFVYGGMSRGFRRRTIKRNSLMLDQLLWASGFGVGTNMAFRRDVFSSIGLFDVALDVGTPSGGGGDVEMFHRLVARGHTMVYEPAALVWHSHRRDRAALQRLVYNNGRSFGAYLLTCARNRTVSRMSILYFALRSWLWSWLLRNLIRPRNLPRHLAAIELAGAFLSPIMYAKAQLHSKKVKKRNEIHTGQAAEATAGGAWKDFWRRVMRLA